MWTALRPGVFGEPTGVLASRSVSGSAAAFGPAETITDQPPGVNAWPPPVAAHPVTGRPVAIWPRDGGGLLVSGRGA